MPPGRRRGSPEGQGSCPGRATALRPSVTSCWGQRPHRGRFSGVWVEVNPESGRLEARGPTGWEERSTFHSLIRVVQLSPADGGRAQAGPCGHRLGVTARRWEPPSLPPGAQTMGPEALCPSPPESPPCPTPTPHTALPTRHLPEPSANCPCVCLWQSQDCDPYRFLLPLLRSSLPSPRAPQDLGTVGAGSVASPPPGSSPVRRPGSESFSLPSVTRCQSERLFNKQPQGAAFTSASGPGPQARGVEPPPAGSARRRPQM